MVHHIKRNRVFKGVAFFITDVEAPFAKGRIACGFTCRKTVDCVIAEFRNEFGTFVPIPHMACRRADTIHIG
ncbi:hypothetical protein D3C81_2022960 [compost metagenome]